jgi:hypothetical protein
VGTVAILLALAVVLLVPLGGLQKDGDASVRGNRSVRFPTITNATGEVEILYPRDHPERGPQSPVSPTSAPGEGKIFNRNGIVAAFSPTPVPRHFVMGGGS